MLVLNSEKTPDRPVVPLPAPTISWVAASSDFRPRPRLSWTIILKPPELPMPRTGGGGIVMMKASLMLLSRSLSSPLEMVGGQALLRPLLERRHGGEDGAGVGRVGEGGAVEAGERHGVDDALGLQDDLGRLAHHRIGARQGDAGRKLDHGDQIALVLVAG